MTSMEQILASAGVGGLAMLVVIRLIDYLRDRDHSDAQHEERQDTKELAYVNLLSDLSANIRASTDAITALKTCEDETQTIVSGFRREVQTTHGTQLERLEAIQGALADIPGATAQLVRASLLDDFAVIQSKLDLARDKILALAEVDKARPVTPREGVMSSAEKVRIEQQAREQIAAMPARKTGEQAAVSAPSEPGERVTDGADTQGQQGG